MVPSPEDDDEFVDAPMPRSSTAPPAKTSPGPAPSISHQGEDEDVDSSADSRPEPPRVSSAPAPTRPSGEDQIGRLISSVSAAVHDLHYRVEFNQLYGTLEDFERIDPEAKRIVVIGCTGAGKSVLLNAMGGWRYKQAGPDGEFEFSWDKTPLFASSASVDSVTKRAEYANLHWFGNSNRPLVAVDTPGYDDTAGADIDDEDAQEAVGQLVADLHNKLKAMGHVHLLLVIHNDVFSNRLNPATYIILKMVQEKFALANKSVWNNVVIAYSKCNENDTSWRSKIADKKRAMQAKLKEVIPQCDVDVPVYALSGVEDYDRSGVPPPQSPDFELLWKKLEEVEPVDTTKLQPFHGAHAKWRELLAEKDAAEALNDAYKSWTAVCFKFAIAIGVLFWRSNMLPWWMSAFLLNYPGPLDEVIYLAGLAHLIGLRKVTDSGKILWIDYLEPYARPYLAQMQPYLDKIQRPKQD